jgi:type II secretory pathway pseudopilin PulG
MLQKLRTRLKNSSGFTLSELLITLLILLMVTVVMAAGIPSALRALYKVEDSSNAQVLLSMAVTRLRDELSTASEVKVDGETTITYTTESGSKSKLTVKTVKTEPTEEKDLGINLQEYVDVFPDGEYKHLLVSDAAANKNLYVTYVKATYENGLVTISGLKAVKYKTESVGADQGAEFPLGENLVIRVLAASGHA